VGSHWRDYVEMGWLMPGRRSQGAATTKVIDFSTATYEGAGAAYDSGTDRALLTGEGTGYNRVKKLLPAAPAGTDQAVYVMRYWLTDQTVSHSQLGIAWEDSMHFGLNFGSTHPVRSSTTSTSAHEAAYTNFLGLGIGNYTNGSVTLGYDSHASTTQYTFLYKSYFTNGNGNNSPDITKLSHYDTNLSLASNRYRKATAILKNATEGAKQTMVWQVRRMSASTEEVQLTTFHDVNSINLSTFSLVNDIDPNDVSGNSSWTASDLWDETINSSVEVGTNWMPTSQTMAFPTYFMFANPLSVGTMNIDYVGVRYDSLF
jgi:hypothetical protein